MGVEAIAWLIQKCSRTRIYRNKEEMLLKMTQGTRLKQIVKLVTRQAAFQTCHLISVQLWQ